MDLKYANMTKININAANVLIVKVLDAYITKKNMTAQNAMELEYVNIKKGNDIAKNVKEI